MTRALPVVTPRRFRFPYRAVSWLTPIAVLALWELSAQTGIPPKQVLTAPSSVLAKAGDLIADGELSANLLASLQRSATGFAIGASLGLGLGLLVGLSTVAEAVLDRSIQMVRAVPFLAILPLIIVWFAHRRSREDLPDRARHCHPALPDDCARHPADRPEAQARLAVALPGDDRRGVRDGVEHVAGAHRTHLSQATHRSARTSSITRSPPRRGRRCASCMPRVSRRR